MFGCRRHRASKSAVALLAFIFTVLFFTKSQSDYPTSSLDTVLPQEEPLRRVKDAQGRSWMRILVNHNNGSTRSVPKPEEKNLFEHGVQNVIIEDTDDVYHYDYHYDDDGDQKVIDGDKKGIEGDQKVLNVLDVQPSLAGVRRRESARLLLDSSAPDSSLEETTRSFIGHVETQLPRQGSSTFSPDFKPHQLSTQIQIPELSRQLTVEVQNERGVPLVVDKIFWSTQVERFVPEGNREEDFERLLHKISTESVTSMQPPRWNRCGRPLNQYVELQDGTALCARYRHPHNKLVHGEVLSFFLSRLLGLDNVPIVILSQANSSQLTWRRQNLTAVEWQEGQLVGLIQWKDGLESRKSRVQMPQSLLNAYETQSPFSCRSKDLSSLSADQLSALVQWSDLILFDFLTGHYDRVASMQDGADREKKPSILHENIRNLRQSWQTGKLWLIDNESGFRDAYELMFSDKKFVRFHERMLKSNCVFHRQTVAKIRALASEAHPDQVLEKYAAAQDPLYKALKWTRAGFKLFKSQFHTRLKRVVAWVDQCQSL